ncbi:hypothetical protein SLEP1_g1819 [Rubroshorea leprosula]|uniref:F-box domain-containing protein n=1 Tax=Rubroshorea leprosula TaxID=152421 RepID=A0AAV5HNU3_9ROSI|nr:hypothetical protein SLEP1_g1819 [Rubroshorea leprosula]
MEKRRRGNRRIPVTTVSDLPIPILMDIFSRLPVKTVFICSCVSKTWLNVVSVPEFRQMAGSICPLLRTPNPQRRFRALHMVPMDTAGDLDDLMRNSTSSTRSSSYGQRTTLKLTKVINPYRTDEKQYISDSTYLTGRKILSENLAFDSSKLMGGE